MQAIGIGHLAWPCCGLARSSLYCGVCQSIWNQLYISHIMSSLGLGIARTSLYDITILGCRYMCIAIQYIFIGFQMFQMYCSPSNQIWFVTCFVTTGVDYQWNAYLGAHPNNVEKNNIRYKYTMRNDILAICTGLPVLSCCAGLWYWGTYTVGRKSIWYTADFAGFPTKNPESHYD
jgi:hypothetical protein